MGCVNSKVRKQEPETISISDLLQELSKFNKRTRYYLIRKNNYYPKKSKKSSSHCGVRADDEKRPVYAEESVAVPSAQNPSKEVSDGETILGPTEEECVCDEKVLVVSSSTQEPSIEVSGSEPIVKDTSEHNDTTEEGCAYGEESLPVPFSAQEPCKDEVSGSKSIVEDTSDDIVTTAEYDANSLAVPIFAANPMNDVILSLPNFAAPSLVQTSLPGFDYVGGFDINQLFYAGDCVETAAVNTSGVAQNETEHEDWISVLESLHMNKMYDPSVDYDAIRHIGEGSFGNVYLAKHKQIQEEFAIKKIPLGNTQNQANIVNELEILRLSLHKNILFLAESYLYNNSVYIVTEYIDGLTLSNICQMATFSEPSIAAITMQCLEGLAYLHERSYVHCDIKGSNILLSRDGKVKLVDFGLAIKTESTVNAGIRGALLWRAPEICKNLPYGHKVDIWSLGMVIIEMLQQHPPLYWIEDVNQMLALSQAGYTTLQEEVQHVVSEELQDFLYQGALVVDPNERLSAEQLLQHSFMMRGDNGECLPEIVRWAIQQQFTQ